MNMKAKILVVDDSSLARRMTRLALEEMGHTVEEAADGAQALERYFLNRHDLVILDMVMNGMYGLEVLAKMRELNPEVRVLVATADIQESTQQQTRAAGAAAFINKPLNRKVLAETVTRILEGGVVWS
jgi:two-component system chemotaxis response regulator CheY